VTDMDLASFSAIDLSRISGIGLGDGSDAMLSDDCEDCEGSSFHPAPSLTFFPEQEMSSLHEQYLSPIHQKRENEAALSPSRSDKEQREEAPATPPKTENTNALGETNKENRTLNLIRYNSSVAMYRAPSLFQLLPQSSRTKEEKMRKNPKIPVSSPSEADKEERRKDISPTSSEVSRVASRATFVAKRFAAMKEKKRQEDFKQKEQEEEKLYLVSSPPTVKKQELVENTTALSTPPEPSPSSSNDEPWSPHQQPYQQRNTASSIHHIQNQMAVTTRYEDAIFSTPTLSREKDAPLARGNRRRYRTVVPVRVLLGDEGTGVQHDSFSLPLQQSQGQAYARMFDQAAQHQQFTW